jgi:hypothetical protein
MMKRKQLAIGGLILFVTGMLLVPAMHKLELANATGCEATCLPCGLADHGNNGATASHGEQNESGNGRSERQRHDSSSCSICHLAKTPVNTVFVAIQMPQCEIVSASFPMAPRAPDFSIPRMIPFSCGPPA